jgi:hypothetical protein
MEKHDKVDFGRLLGFETVGEQLEDGVDFRNETISDRLGAKIGPLPEESPPR